MDRRTLRDTAFKMLFEAEFKKDENAVELYPALLAEHEAEDCDYLNDVFFGVIIFNEEGESHPYAIVRFVCRPDSRLI